MHIYFIAIIIKILTILIKFNYYIKRFKIYKIFEFIFYKV
jgi:hypothetical protein